MVLSLARGLYHAATKWARPLAAQACFLYGWNMSFVKCTSPFCYSQHAQKGLRASKETELLDKIGRKEF